MATPDPLTLPVQQIPAEVAAISTGENEQEERQQEAHVAKVMDCEEESKSNEVLTTTSTHPHHNSADCGESIEYRTLRNCYPELVDHVKLQLTTISSALFSKSYIPNNIHEDSTSDGVSDERKANKLLDAVLAKVKLNPDTYHGFVDILGREGPWADDIIKHLKDHFHSIKSEMKQTQHKASQECETEGAIKEVLVTVDNQEHTNQSLELTNVDTKSQEDLKRVICQKMNVFELDEDCISHLQYYNQKFCQYLLLKDMRKIQDGVKINVVRKKKQIPIETIRSTRNTGVCHENGTSSYSSHPLHQPAKELQVMEKALSNSTVKKFWEGKDVLRVHFINPEAISEWKHYPREPITTTNILAWAAVWNNSYGSSIPTIEMANSIDKSDIRVKFVDLKGGCSSMVGTEATGKEITMVLDLNQHSSDKQRSLVIHMFGHALGLEHEHQRPEFWEVLGKHLNLEKMKKDLRSQSGDEDDSEFERLWMVKKRVSDTSEYKYDPASIMHFCFDVKWLKGSLSVEANIDNANQTLSKKEMMYLKAIHTRSRIGTLPKNPSKLDIQKLVNAYESINKNRPAVSGKDLTTLSSFKYPTSNDYISFKKQHSVQDEALKMDERHNEVPKPSEIWRDRSVLKVFFMNAEVLDEWQCGTSIGTIMAWASSWNSPLVDKIPRFEETKTIGNSDIRVKFSDSHGSWSAVGTDVSNVLMTDPTMMLDMKNFDRDFQKYLVIHQFGHALGLEHEHQRMDFWSGIKKHIDEKKMEEDPSIGNYSPTETFKRDWLKLGRRTHRESKCSYDPQSIMHWWFAVDWLKNQKYHELENIKSDSSLTDDEKRFLEGIHARNRKYVHNPSKTDIEYLQDVYRTESKNETIPASEFESFSDEKILEHVDWNKIEGIWISTNSLKHATDGESVKQKWEQVALSTAKIDRALFLEIAKRSLKDNITVTEEFIAG